jgi:hypothetical protein
MLAEIHAEGAELCLSLVRYPSLFQGRLDFGYGLRVPTYLRLPGVVVKDNPEAAVSCRVVFDADPP